MNTTTLNAPVMAAAEAPITTASPTPSEAWQVQLDSGLTMFVPPRLLALSTYVLLEQERWFEAEINLLPHLLQGGVNALDIGANHGVYALEMARVSGTGQVHAFEPTSAPRECLLRSVQANGLAERVTVVPAGLADVAGSTVFTISDNSELNARQANVQVQPQQRQETVQLQTLDGYLAAHASGVHFGFVKLDAEGDELRVLAGAKQFFAEQSPVVMFEYKHGATPNVPLIAAFEELGYSIFRWSAELELLLPFNRHTDETDFALNLVAVRPAEQVRLGLHGVLATAEALAHTQAPETSVYALQAWCARKALLGLVVPSPTALRASVAEAAGEVYTEALCAVATAYMEPNVSPAGRVALLVQARESLMAHANDGGNLGPAGWSLVSHCLYALGQQRAAVEMASQLLGQWTPDIELTVPCVPPAHRVLDTTRSTPSGPWLQQKLAEFLGMRASLSSYFTAPEHERWAALLHHTDHAPEVERRFLLTHLATDRLASSQHLQLIKHCQHGSNGGLWQGLLTYMRVGSDAKTQTTASPAPNSPAAPTAVGPATLAGAQTDALHRADRVLLALPVDAVSVVDVGASPLADATEPYAALVQKKRAKVVGFEPDEEAMQALLSRHGVASTHRYIQAVVGDGQDATFHETHWSLTASLLEPNHAVLNRFHELEAAVQLKAKHPVKTVRLDDVITPQGMDLLKIDVQGGEGLVFSGAAERLNECLMVWTEVEFAALYKGQPLFAEIDTQLRGHGLQFHCIASGSQIPLANWPMQGVVQSARPQLLWADMIYFPQPERLATLSASENARLALLAHYVASSYDVCHAALLRLDAEAGSNFAQQYLQAMQLQA
jgi:protein O-GlcNAc transferase